VTTRVAPTINVRPTIQVNPQPTVEPEQDSKETDEDILASLLGQGVRGVTTEKAGLAEISSFYDPSLSLEENLALRQGMSSDSSPDILDSALMYGGGIVQPTDLTDELLRILEGR